MRKRIWLLTNLILILSLILCPLRSYAESYDWPQCSGVEAEGACLMDAETGTVLYGKNLHEKYYPASITKILTALLVIENDDLDDVLTFSHRAVYDVEAGSSSAGYDEGDTITVRDALYAMLLASANEVANALAEHTAGSIEAFCDMMNAKAAEIGCTDSHFANPSGLNNEEHYTSPHDFALICREAYKNDILVQISGTTYHKLPPSRNNPEEFTVYAHHNMLKKNNELYYEGIIGGKTGYTSLAGNTLVTCAERDGLKLISVVLNGHQTHYSDTKTLLDFGFENFRSQSADSILSKYKEMFRKMDITGSGLKGDDVLYFTEENKIIVPKESRTGDISDIINYEVGEQAPDEAIARISYMYGEREVGRSYVMRKFDHSETVINVMETGPEEIPEEEPEELTLIDKFLSLPLWIIIASGVFTAAVLAGAVLLLLRTIGGRKKNKVNVDFTVPIGGVRSRSRKNRSRRL